MPTVSDLKADARNAEDKGDLVEAIEIYQHILRHLRSWPDALAEELDLYIRVGDLRVDLGQPVQAFAAYRQAAEHYARLGSATDIKRLCVRMVNVVPASADSYGQYARRLLHHGHLEAALEVIKEYADRARLKDVKHTVVALTGRSNGETRALLTDLLDTIERDIAGHSVAARRIAEELAAAAAAPTAAPTSAEPAPLVQKPPAQPPSSGPERAKPEATVTEPGRALKPLVPDPSPPAHQPRPAAATTQPRRPPQPKVASAATSKGSQAGGGINWRPLGVGGAVAAAVTLLVVATVRMGGGEGTSSPDAMAAMIDTSPGAVDEQTPAAPDTLAATRTNPPPAASPPAQSAPPPVEPDPPAPVLATPPTETVVDTAPEPDTTAVEADSSAVITQPVVVGDLPVQSIIPIQFRGQSGFRVVHQLDSTTQFVVESYPVDSTSARRYPLGSVVVSNIPPDTTVSIVRFDERYLVFASGTVPEDSARVLIGLLRVQQEN